MDETPPQQTKFAISAFSRRSDFEDGASGLKNILKKPLTRSIPFARIKNCSARQSAYRAGGGKISKAD